MTGPLPNWLLPFMIPLSWVYRAGIARRNRAFDRDPHRVQRLPIPVISIGNITTGGTGKSPMVAWTVEQLLAANHRPVIAMRGYGARPGELSDEETEHMQRLSGRGVEIIVHPDRHHALSGYLSAHSEVDCVVLDDGFQHRQLHRDLDIVLIDATRDTFSDRLLPAGHLREPLENLGRADAVVVSRAEAPDESIARAVQRHHEKPPVAWSRHGWSTLEVFDGEGIRKEEVAWLKGRRVMSLLGIGNPAAMRQQIENAGATIIHDFPVRDHQHYDPRKSRFLRKVTDLMTADQKTHALLTTGKDWVKLRSLIDWDQWTIPIVIPTLELDFVSGENELRSLVLSTLADGSASRSDPRN